jgi:cephalosporin-C deacetylase-like acetyl esterase
MLVLAGSLTPAFALQIREPEKSQDKPAGFYLKPDSIQKEVTFKTSDGWTIFGTYTVPMAHKQEEKLPAVLFLHGSLHSQTVWTDYPGWVKLQNSIATLRIDWRGCGKSEGEIPFEDFSLAQREKVTLDVEAALEFLASKPEVDSDRIGVAAEEFSVGPAIKSAMENPRVKAFVLLSGTLDQPAMDLIASNLTKSTLFIVDPERIGILGATFSAKLAMYATMVIPKLKAVGMLTAFVWPWDQANDYKTIGAIGRPVLLVTGDGFGEQTKKFADIVSKDRRNKVLTYPGGIFGYALLRIDKRLEPEIAKWFKDQLIAGK